MTLSDDLRFVVFLLRVFPTIRENLDEHDVRLWETILGKFKESIDYLFKKLPKNRRVKKIYYDAILAVRLLEDEIRKRRIDTEVLDFCIRILKQMSELEEEYEVFLEEDEESV